MVLRSPEFFLDLVNYFGRTLHLESLQEKIIWMLGFPAGFKPNMNLAHFIGCSVLELISLVKKLNIKIVHIRYFLTINVAAMGTLGYTV